MKTNTEAILFLNALVSNIDTGILSFDMEGFVTLVNKKALEYLGVNDSVKHVIDTDVESLIKIEELSTEVRHCLSKSRKEFHLGNIFHNDHYLIIVGNKLLDGMLITLTDVTTDVLAKDKATQSLLLGQEIERRRMSQEIHDGLGPNMSALILQLDAVHKKLDAEKQKTAIETIKLNVSEIAQDIRQISHDLMPSSLIDFGVCTALQNFTNRISSTGNIEVDYSSTLEDRSVPQEYELNIYRIVQELVNNSIKHSNCKCIQIKLTHKNDVVSVFFQDDGKGMKLEQAYKGIGLNNINTRVDSLQGTLEIDTQVGAGFTAHIEFPLKILQQN